MLAKGALFSPDKKYRYYLWRIWDTSKKYSVFLMLNPSTADETVDDPTIRKCMGFGHRWDAGGIIVVNLFAYRSTSPAALKKVEDPVGPDNDKHILNIMSVKNRPNICAWGSHGVLLDRASHVTKLLRSGGVELNYLRMTERSNQPGHPLYIPYETPLTSWQENPIETQPAAQ